MNTGIVWLLKLVLSHLLADFVLQPKNWLADRDKAHFGSVYLYLHAFIAGVLASLFIGWSYWLIGVIIFMSHILIDGWNSFRREAVAYFFIEQVFHATVIALCFYFTFSIPVEFGISWKRITSDIHFWEVMLSFILLTAPASAFIGMITRNWREKIDTDKESLANAGKWIGIMERIIVLVLVLHEQYEAIGLLITAKSILRFNEKDRPEIKTEYLLIGTLLSIGLAMIVAIGLKMIM